MQKNFIITEPVFKMKLYHYTNAHAFMAILQYRKLWATDIKYMNDKRENAVAKLHLNNFLNDLYPTNLVTEYQKIALKQFLNTRKHSFVSSFSKRFDNLSMFRMYGPPDGTYCIGFDKDWLEQIPNTEIFETDYEPTNQVSDIKKFLTDAIEILKDCEEKDIDAEYAGRHLVQTEMFRVFSELSVRQKSSEFIAEEEIRIISRDWKNQKMRVSSRGNVLIPYVEIELPNDEIEVELIMGPNSNTDLAFQSMQDMGHIARREGTKWNFSIPGNSLHGGLRVL